MDPRDQVKIKIFGSRPVYADRDLQDEPRVIEIIKDQVLPRRDAEYFQINAEIKRSYDATPRYIVVYLLRKDIYSAETVKVEVDANYQVTRVVDDYSADDEEDEDEPRGLDPGTRFDEDIYALDPDFTDTDSSYEDAFDFVVASPVPEIPSAKAAVEHIFNLALAAGLKPKKLLGAEATVTHYRQYLQSGLKGFVNVGHGNPSGIVLADGALNAAWFNSLAATALKPCVIYFNSCQVHNDPLKAAIVKAGARTFIGGIVSLLIGASEEVCKSFWSDVFKNVDGMKTILLRSEKANYPNQGAHGIIGDTGVFTKLNLRLAHAMWVHGHSMEIEVPDRLQLLQRLGYFIRARGKPFTNNWFHFAIPTPVLVGSERLIVGSVLLRLRVGPGASVSAVHIYDGEQRIAVHNDLKLAPVTQFELYRFDVPTHPAVKWGVGISVCMQFADSANLPPDTRLLVDFVAAGCDFMQIVKPVQLPTAIKPVAVPIDGVIPTLALDNGGEFADAEAKTASRSRSKRVPAVN